MTAKKKTVNRVISSLLTLAEHELSDQGKLTLLAAAIDLLKLRQGL